MAPLLQVATVGIGEKFGAAAFKEYQMSKGCYLVLALAIFTCFPSMAFHSLRCRYRYSGHIEGRVSSNNSEASLIDSLVRGFGDRDFTNAEGRYRLSGKGTLSFYTSFSSCPCRSIKIRVCSSKENFYEDCKDADERICSSRHFDERVNFRLEQIVLPELALGSCKRNDAFYTTSDGGCKNLRTQAVASALAPTTLNWVDALSYCDDLDQNVFSDWRLPSKAEIVGLQQTKFYLNFNVTEYYWSASTVNTLKSIAVRPSSGDTKQTPKTGTLPVFCVR